MVQVATVETEKAERLAKALCNHFARRIPASYSGNMGTIDFGEGRCELTATPTTLTLQVAVDDAAHLPRIQKVVVDHLLRFTPDDDIQIQWEDPA